MSTYTDGVTPSVTPEPADRRPESRPATDGSVTPGSAATGTGPGWLQDELARRMAAGRSGSGGRHARRDVREEPSDSPDYRPRHSVAPQPTVPRPAAPQVSPPVRRGQPSTAWSGPEPRPTPGPVGGGPVGGVPDAPPVAPHNGAGPATPVHDPLAPVDPVVPVDAERGVLGGPSLSRPFPKAFRRGTDGAPVAGPAVFGGPGFSGPATAPSPGPPASARPAAARPASGRSAPEPAAEFGGPGFGASIARPDRDWPAPSADDEPEPPHLRASSVEVTPPRAPARLLAPPEHVVEAQGHRRGAAAAGAVTAGRPAVPRPTDDGPVDDHYDDDDDGDHSWDDGESTVLWSADAPPLDLPEQRGRGRDEELDGPDTETVLVYNRVKVIFSERRNGAPAVRTVVDVQEGGAVGELLRSNLIGSQLAVALRFAIGVALTLGLLPLAFAMFPEIGRTEVLGLRLPWLLLGVLVYPFLLVLGWWHTRTAERVEQDFADHVQD